MLQNQVDDPGRHNDTQPIVEQDVLLARPAFCPGSHAHRLQGTGGLAPGPPASNLGVRILRGQVALAVLLDITAAGIGEWLAGRT